MKIRLVGRTVDLKLINGEYEVDVLAKVDTGAYSSSIDETLANELNLGDWAYGCHNPLTFNIKSASGSGNRDFFDVLLSDGYATTHTLVNIARRGHLEYKMIIGRRDIAALRYFVDVSKEKYIYKSKEGATASGTASMTQEPTVPKPTVVNKEDKPSKNEK